jgi:hypothetical protein
MRHAIVSVALLCGFASSAGAQAIAEIVGPTGQIPREAFKTWSLFLVCNPDWATSDRGADLANLYHRFKPFGDAIGRDNLAVWFWKARAAVNDPRLADNVDVARSAEYCAALGKPPSGGPYLVVTTAYPDVTNFPKDRAIFELASLAPKDVAKLLNTLTDQLLLQGRVDAAMVAAAMSSGPPPQPPSLWIRLLEGMRQSIIGFGCAVKLQIESGVLNAELRACAE